MSDIIDIVHRISYDVVDDGLKGVQAELKKQLDTIEVLGKRQIRLAEIYDKTSTDDLKKRQKVVDLMGKNKDAIEKVGNALEKTVIHNKAFNQALIAEQGIIGSLTTKLSILEQRRNRATSPAALKGYNQQIQQIQNQLTAARTTGTGGGGGLGGLLSRATGGGGLGGLVGGVSRFLPAIGGALAITSLGSQIFDVTKKFEKFNAILKNTYQDSTQANLAFEKIRQFAAETPFSVEELTESFIKLKNRGFDPTKEELTQIGDLAASQGKSFDQLTEAILDAQTGEFERLKEFGIKAKTTGDTVTLAFKGVEKQVKKTDQEALRNAVLSFGKMQGVVGSMAAVSQTLEGKVSNLGDSFDNLLSIVGNRGGKSFFGGIIDGAKGLVDIFTKLIEVSPADKLREEQAELNGLAVALIAANDNEQARSLLLTEINQKYPEFLAGMAQEEVSIAAINSRLEVYNTLTNRRIALLRTKANVEERQTEFNDAIKQSSEDYKVLGDVIEKLNENRRKAQQSEIKTPAIQTAEDLKKFYATYKKELEKISFGGSLNPFSKNFGQAESGALTVEKLIRNFTKNTNEQTEAQKKLNTATSLQSKNTQVTIDENNQLLKQEEDKLDLYKKQADEIKKIKGFDEHTDTINKLNEINGLIKTTENNIKSIRGNQYQLTKELGVSDENNPFFVKPTTPTKTTATKAKGKEKSPEEKALEDLEKQETAAREAENRRFEEQKRKQLEALKAKTITQKEYDNFLAVETENHNKKLLDIEKKYGELKVKYQKANEQQKTKTRLKEIENAYLEIDNKLKAIAEAEIKTAIDHQKQLNDDLIAAQEDGLAKELAFIDTKYQRRREELKKQEDAEKEALKIAETNKNEAAKAIILKNLKTLTALIIGLDKQQQDEIAAARLKKDLELLEKQKSFQLDAIETKYQAEIEAGNKLFTNREAQVNAELQKLQKSKTTDEQIEATHGRKKAKLLEQQKFEEEKLTRLKELAKLYIERDFADQRIKRLELELATATGKRKEDIENELSGLRATYANLNDKIREGQKGVNEGDKAEKQKARDERLKDIEDYAQLANAAAQAAATIISAFEAAADREISIREKRVEKAQKIADRGNAEALQAEEDRLERAQAQKEKYARQQIAINLIQQASAVALGIAQAAALPFPANIPAIAATITALAAGFATVKQLTADNQERFAEGVIAYRGKGTGKSDSNVVRISHGESVITAEGTQQNKPILEAINKGAKFRLANLANIRNLATPYVSDKQTAGGTDLSKKFDAMQNELSGIKTAIEERQPTQLYWDKRGIVTIVEEVIQTDRKKWKV